MQSTAETLAFNKQVIKATLKAVSAPTTPTGRTEGEGTDQPQTENSFQPTQGKLNPVATMQSPPRNLVSLRAADALRGAGSRATIQEEDHQGRGLPGSLYSSEVGEERQQTTGEVHLNPEETMSGTRGTFGDSSERSNGEGLNEDVGAISWMEETTQMRLRRLQRPNPMKGGSPDASPVWYEEPRHVVPLHETSNTPQKKISGQQGLWEESHDRAGPRDWGPHP